MDRLEVRELVQFVAVAEHLHFGRAAEQLGIAQPPLSRTISRLERRMGVRLLDRTSRRVTLTEAGGVLLRESRKVLAAVDGAVRRAQHAARPERLVIAVHPGTGAGLLPAVLDAYGRGPNPVPVELLFTKDQAAALHKGAADVALMCATDRDSEDLDKVDLVEEAPVVLLPVTHPLATHKSLTTQDLRTEPHFQTQCPPAGLDEIVDRVALGQLVVVVGENVTGRLGRSVTAVPVSDLPNTQLILAWPRTTPLAARDALVHAAVTAVLPEP